VFFILTFLSLYVSLLLFEMSKVFFDFLSFGPKEQRAVSYEL